jgi:hypothetical protein
MSKYVQSGKGKRTTGESDQCLYEVGFLTRIHEIMFRKFFLQNNTPKNSRLKLTFLRSTKSTIRGFPIGHDDFSRRSSQRQMDENYRKTIDAKVHRSASLLSAGQFYCETPSEFDQVCFKIEFI